MKTVSTTEAKARLNALLTEVADGQEVAITRHGRPVAVLSKADPPARKLGQFTGIIALTEAFDEPMGEEELALWGETG